MVQGRPWARVTDANDRTVNEVMVDYLRFAATYYRKPDGNQTSEADCAKLVVRPRNWKMEHHGGERRIYIGPRAQEVLKPSLRTELEVPLFSPREAIAERNRAWRAARKTKVQPS